VYRSVTRGWSAIAIALTFAIAQAPATGVAAPAAQPTAKPNGHSNITRPMSVELHSSKTKVDDSGLPAIDAGSPTGTTKKTAPKKHAAKVAPHAKATAHP